jgi:hypothetical protein
VVNRAGIRTLRDPFCAKPCAMLYATERVGGGVEDFDVIKLMRFSARGGGWWRAGISKRGISVVNLVSGNPSIAPRL